MSKSEVSKALTKSAILESLANLSKSELAEALTIVALRRIAKQEASAEFKSKPSETSSAKTHAKKKKVRVAKEEIAKTETKTEAKTATTTAFDRDAMWRDPDSDDRFEGMWRSHEVLDPDAYNAYEYPWPIAHLSAFKGEAAFLAKLRAMEKKARENADADPEASAGLTVIVHRGKSKCESVLDPEESVGNNEYRDADAGVYWSESLSAYYVPRYHVRPSREFFDYVMQYPLDS